MLWHKKRIYELKFQNKFRSSEFVMGNGVQYVEKIYF